MECRQLSQLDTPAIQVCGGSDEQGMGSFMCHRREGICDLTSGANLQNLNL